VIKPIILNPIVAEANPVTPHKYSYDPENNTNGGINANKKAPPYNIPMPCCGWCSLGVCA
jgi:hypothetical protein